nr:serinethreonine-protein kinase afc2 [Ipomoea batatas]
MADLSSVDVILEFLRRNKFTRAEAALRSELSNHPDLIGVLQKLALEDKELNPPLDESNGWRTAGESMGMNCHNIGAIDKETSSKSSRDISKELIINEIDCGTGKNGPDCKWKNVAHDGEQSKANESVVTSAKNLSFCNSSKDTAIELYSRKYNPNNSPFVSGKAIPNLNEAHDSGKASEKSGEDGYFSNEITSWSRSTSKTNLETKQEKSHHSDLKEVDQSHKKTWGLSKDAFGDNPWNDCMVKTVFPFSKTDMLNFDHNIVIGDKKEGKRKLEITDIKTDIKEQGDDDGRASYFGRAQRNEPKDLSGFDFPLASENQKEELPRLPPVRLKSEEKPFNIHWVEKFERDEIDTKIANSDKSYLIGSFLDVPVGQEISHLGKRPMGGSWLSVSQGIAEDTSDLVSGFATIGDGISDSVDYPNEYWDSDEYDDEDDVGYTRQPIEDENWFLAHEIDYPSDNEKGTGHGSIPDPQRSQNREEDEQSFVEEDSYFSGERYIQSKDVDRVRPSDDPMGLSVTEIYRRADHDGLAAQHDGRLMDEDELNLIRAEPVWQGFVTQTNELVMLGDEKVLNECSRSHIDQICLDDDQHGSVRSIGVGINSDAADIGSEVRESLVGGSIDGDMEYFHDNYVGIGGSRSVLHDSDKTYSQRSNGDKKAGNHSSDKFITCVDRTKSHLDGGFSFPPPRGGQLVQTNSGKSIWSNEVKSAIAEDTDDCLVTNDGMLVPWRQKSSESSPVKSSRYDNNANATGSANSSPSSLPNYGYTERDHVKKEHDTQIIAREEDLGVSLEDEEVVAVQEQVKQIKAQEEEFETFDLKIVHRKNRTGFEEDKNFHVVLNSVIAGRYHVTEYLGSAAFSKAIQAHDLHTGMDVCVKIIKNNKDFFDQSLDEIKLLKFVNKHDPADKYHVLRLYDYFYYREHLLIVCELLKANLYEFHKFNRESGGEVYFTMPRLQSITIQCLEALQFLHSLGLIHCDLKPENILVKSYSRCEVKVIDLGSSCFETDHLCSYVQSRSYRAPEVILGLPYDKKIDIWSLGCILAELCTGNVLFQNDSPATLLARVIGIISPIDQKMLAKGKDTYKYFTKNHMLYERNQETNRLEYLIPKKTSLRHRLPVGDQCFIDFLTHLLEINPKKRPSATEALKHPWLSYPYEPISS